MSVPVRVVLADDSILLREGLATLLAARGFEVVAQVGDAEGLLDVINRARPDVAVVDIRMPPTSTDEGLRAAANIGTSHPEVGVLVLSEHLEPEYASRLLATGDPGRGYLLKDTVTHVDAFVDAVRRVASGESVVDPAIIRVVLGRLRANDPLDLLSDRERDILAMMAEGRSNKAIAAQLVLSNAPSRVT